MIASSWRVFCAAAFCDCFSCVRTPTSMSARSGFAVTTASPVTRIDDMGDVNCWALTCDTAHASNAAIKVFIRADLTVEVVLFYQRAVVQNLRTRETHAHATGRYTTTDAHSTGNNRRAR